jgi:mono/diheme cytochrome c family protein
VQNKFWLGFGAGIVLAVLISAAAGYFAVMNGLVPANADAKPGNIERWAARTSLNVTVRREMPTGANPVSTNAQNLTAGMKLYEENCSVCHGVASGKPTNIAKGFYQRAPQFGKHGVEDDPEGETFWKVTHGIRFTAMPSFIGTLDDQQRWQVTLFLKHMDALPPQVSRAWRRSKAT